MIIRRESIDSETGNRIAGEPLSVPTTQATLPSTSAADKERLEARSKRIQEVITRALQGKLTAPADIPYWQVDKLHDTHIEMIFDSAQGMTALEIGAKYSYSAQQVAKIMLHPDAQIIRATLNSVNAEGLTDMSERFRLLAPEMLSVKTEMVRDKSTPAAIRDRIATDILDRAGYGAVKREEKKVEHSVAIPTSIAATLLSGLEEANRVRTIDYTKHIRRPQDDEIAQAANLLPGAGHTSEEGAPLRTPNPADGNKLGELIINRKAG